MGERARGCLKVGCIGCGIAVVLALAAVGVTVGLAVLAGKGEKRMEAFDSEHQPQAPTLVHPQEEQGAAPEIRDRIPPVLESADPRLADPGRIVLDVSMCDFDLVPGEAGESLRLEGEYDSANIELSEDWETHGSVGWTYRLSLGRRGFFMRGADRADCKMALVVPRATPFVLEGEMGIGESTLELGGLYVLSVDLSTGVGEHEVRFSEPLPVPLDRLHVRGSIGELLVAEVGNASPAEVEVRHNIGEATVDLQGHWRNASAVTVRCGMGACRLQVPNDVGIEVASASMGLGESNFDVLDRGEARAGQPTLRLTLSGRMGEFRIED